MFCAKCGTKNLDTDSFCKNCGASLKRNAPASVSSAQTPPTPQSRSDAAPAPASNTQAPSAPQPRSDAAPKPQQAPTFFATQPQPVAPHASAAQETSPKKQPKDKKGLIIAIVIAAVIIVFAISAVLTSCFGLLGVSVKDSVNEYTWGELSKISSEISKASDESAAIDIAKQYNLVSKNGKLDGNQTKSVQLSNGQTITVQIAGFAHDELSKGGKGGKAGITFIFKEAIANQAINPTDANEGGWGDSQLRSWLASDGMSMLPDDLQKSIVEVEKKTNNTGQTSNVSSVTDTSDKLWLFSSTEICGSVSWFSYQPHNDVINSEGSQYKLFSDQDINPNGSNAALIKNLNGSATAWWSRSPYLGSHTGFMYVQANGSPQGSALASNLMGVVPGFCI